MGAGKSILTYMAAQHAQHDLHWITVYTPNCQEWVRSQDVVVAEGYFLDRLVEAVPFLSHKIYALDKSVRLPGKFANWEDYAADVESRGLVRKAFREAKH